MSTVIPFRRRALGVAGLLDRLEDVRERSPGQWASRCPAHEDRSPSLSVREGDDGRVLLHCFAGCTPTDVVDSLGLTLADLFDRPAEHLKKGRRPTFNYREILKLLRTEAIVVWVYASTLEDGGDLDDLDHDRLIQAVARICKTLEIARVG